MNTIKTVFLAALLSAAAFGVYVGVTGSPPSFGPRRRAKEWDETSAPESSTDASLAGMPTAPLVSIGESSPRGNQTGVAQPAAAPSAAAPSAAGASATAAPAAGLPSANPSEPKPPGESPLDRYSSNQPYPSSRPDDAADLAAAPTRTADERYPSGQDVGSAGALADESGPPTQDTGSHADYAALMQSVQTLLAQNRLADAHLELSEWFGAPEFTPDEDAQITELLDRLAGTVVYSRQHLLERAHEVQPGETLEKIADAYEVPWQLLANINGIRDPRAVRPGDQLKVVRGPFSAYIDLQRFRLVLYVGSRYAGRFPIGIGEDHPTPEGKFVVQGKLINPTYYGQPVIDKDDPSNPMGEYALDLGNDIWIHGTNDPQSIGRAGSRGCIRLQERDIKDVFDILTARSDRTAGSPVVIGRLVR